MPTFPKLFSALWFAATAYLAAYLYVPTLPEGTQVGWFLEVSAAIGFLVGWIWMGPRAKERLSDSFGAGIVSSIITLFWTMLCFSIVEMLSRSLDMRYRGVMDALVGIFDLMVYFGGFLIHPATPVTLLVGGVIGGILAHFVARRTS